jgi:type VI protein secretion system component Hcp
VAGLVVAAGGALVAGPETKPNARLQTTLDGQRMTENVTLNFAKVKFPPKSRPQAGFGAVDVTMRADTPLARKFDELSRIKTRLPWLTIESTERDVEEKYLMYKLEHVLVTSYSMSAGAEPSKTAGYRLSYEQITRERP